MARVTTSGLISDISGKVNGSVFQRTQGGLIMRNQSGKIDSNTLRSNSQKVGMASVQGDWQGLTDAERILWQTFALYLNRKQKHSNSLIVNGHQLFIRINNLRYALKDWIPILSPYLLTTPLLIPPPQPITISNITKVDPPLILSTSDSIAIATEVLFVFISRPLSGSQKSGNQKMVLQKFTQINGFSQNIEDSYISIYGRLPNVGEWLQTKTGIYNTASQNISSLSVKRLQVL